MSERHTSHEQYWTADEQIGELKLWPNATYALRLKAHLAREPYRQSAREEIVPLRYRSGERTYVHGRAYVLLPDIQLNVRLFPAPARTGASGIVSSSEQTGLRHKEVGDCQAWYYERDRILILWEAFLRDPHRHDNPLDDSNIAALWDGFEQFLLRRFPAARLLATAHDDPLYETRQYHEFLQSRGYRRLNRTAFGKLPHHPRQPTPPVSRA